MKMAELELVTKEELGEITRRSPWFWWKQAKSGKVPCIRTEGRLLFRVSTIREWMAQQEAASVARPEQPGEYGKIRRID